MSLEIVTRIREQYPTPLGNRHWAFLNQVARALQLGLCAKESGANVNGVSLDVVMARTGEAWDILMDAEGEARPAWRSIGSVDVNRYRHPELTEEELATEPTNYARRILEELVAIRTILSNALIKSHVTPTADHDL